MACRIIYKKTRKRRDGKDTEPKSIAYVNAKNGNRSLLYDQLYSENKKSAGHDALKKSELKQDALKQYARIFTKKFKSSFGDWENKDFDKTKLDKNGEPLYRYVKLKPSLKIVGSVKNIKNLTLEEKIKEGFLKDMNISLKEFEDFNDIISTTNLGGIDILNKMIETKEGESILPEVAFLAYSLLGRKNNKIKSELRRFVNNWDKYQERFEYHRQNILDEYGFIEDVKDWKNKVRDRVIVDFLEETINDYYTYGPEFEKVMDNKWTREDFSLWNKFMEAILKFIDSLKRRFFNANNSERKKQILNNLGYSIADEIVNQNYQYFDYKLSEDQLIKSYEKSISNEEKAKEILKTAFENDLILTGSLALRKQGNIYRTIDEKIHDLDFTVPYNVTTKVKDSDKLFRDLINLSNKKTLDAYVQPEVNINSNRYDKLITTLKDFKWFSNFLNKHPNFEIYNSFNATDETGKVDRVMILGAVGAQYRNSNGYHNEIIKVWRKHPVTKEAVEVKINKKVKHKKGDYIQGTGILVDFFINILPTADESAPIIDDDGIFKYWKDTFKHKLIFGRKKDLVDYKAWVPFQKKDNDYSFNNKAFSKLRTHKPKSVFDDLEDGYIESLSTFLDKAVEDDNFNKYGKSLIELTQKFLIDNKISIPIIINNSIRAGAQVVVSNNRKKLERLEINLKDSRANEEKLLHELVHVISVSTIEHDPVFSKVWYNFYRRANVKIHENAHVPSHLKYFLSNEHEFMTGLMTNSEFRQLLSKVDPIRPKKEVKNLLDEVVQFIKRIFNLFTNNVTLLEDATLLAKDLIIGDYSLVHSQSYQKLSKKTFYINNPDILVDETNQEQVFAIETSEESKTKFNTPNINYKLKAIDILQSDKAKQVFEKGKNNKWSLDKILTELQVPKQQKNIILSGQFEKNYVVSASLREDIIMSLAADNSFTVEINTATKPDSFRQIGRDQLNVFTLEGYTYSNIGTVFHKANAENLKEYESISKDEYDKAKQSYSKTQEKQIPSDYYSNLTVPGGTNYTENEIRTPDITSSIKGHAQFSTDQGIGWFRSDNQGINLSLLEQQGIIKKVPC
jgi:hypothetical protein